MIDIPGETVVKVGRTDSGRLQVFIVNYTGAGAERLQGGQAPLMEASTGSRLSNPAAEFHLFGM